MRSILLIFLFICGNLLHSQNNSKNEIGNKGGGCLLRFHNDTLDTQFQNNNSIYVSICWDNNRTQTIPTCLYRGFHCIIEKQINFGGYDTIFDSWNDSITAIADTAILSGASYNYRMSRFNHATYLTSYSDTINLQTVGLSELKVKQFKVWPNPAKEQINVQVKDEQIGKEYELFNYSGQALRTGLIKSNNTKLYLSKLSSGIYFIRINSQTEKFIIKK